MQPASVKFALKTDTIQIIVENLDVKPSFKDYHKSRIVSKQIKKGSIPSICMVFVLLFFMGSLLLYYNSRLNFCYKLDKYCKVIYAKSCSTLRCRYFFGWLVLLSPSFVYIRIVIQFVYASAKPKYNKKLHKFTNIIQMLLDQTKIKKSCQEKI